MAGGEEAEGEGAELTIRAPSHPTNAQTDHTRTRCRRVFSRVTAPLGWEGSMGSGGKTPSQISNQALSNWILVPVKMASFALMAMTAEVSPAFQLASGLVLSLMCSMKRSSA